MTTEEFRTRHLPGWQALWPDLTGQPADLALFESVLQAYAEPQRHYHTLEHLDACLRHLAAMRTLARRPDEVALALWFHDAVYTIGATDNEQRSADWAHAALRAHDAGADVADRVHALVMVTRHDQPPRTADEALLLDVDLAILGAPAAVFDAYEQQIVREYRAVPAAAFRSNRRRILQSFLERPRIYHTARFHDTREAMARANLSRSIAALSP